MSRIFLSPPDVRGPEVEMLLSAVGSNWIAPVGPDIDSFEAEIAGRTGRRCAVGLSSGTAALHLGLKELGVGPGDDVFVSTLTFAAPANAVTYLGATPVLIDSDRATWTMSPRLLAEALEDSAKVGRLPAAVVVVDLYGQCADYEVLAGILQRYGVPLLEDAAEALGATYGQHPAGSFGSMAILSFNGNKIITTSGGGMLVTDDDRLADRVRYLSTQAREPAPHYEHVEVGYNYRLSNLLAAFGRGQLLTLDERVERRRLLNRRYRHALAGVPGIDFMPEAPYGMSTCWLTCITLDPEVAGCSREDLRLHLERHDIESRPTWKPMHLQKAFVDAPRWVDGTSDRIFERGLCLPSGSSLSDDEQDRVISLVLEMVCA